jgi:hypothetical protein
VGAFLKLPKWMRSGATPAPRFTPTSSSDPLQGFLEWYCANGPAVAMSPAGIEWAGNLPGITLYRAGQFQVQQFLFPPGANVPPHRHPHVDTVEMHIAGNYDFRVNGVSAIPLEHLHDRRGNVSRWWGRGVRVRPTDWHDLSVYEGGACFLSVQHWLKGQPSSVGLDWEGQPANEAHGELIAIDAPR